MIPCGMIRSGHVSDEQPSRPLNETPNHTCLKPEPIWRRAIETVLQRCDCPFPMLQVVGESQRFEVRRRAVEIGRLR